MKDSRIGESLWSIWEGSGYEQQLSNSIVYYTEDHVDLDNEVVRKALASAIQRDGVVYSLSEAFQAIDAGFITIFWVGTSGEELYQEACPSNGINASGVLLSNIIPVTFVEVPDLV
jgi:ABC-type transport system substrate-binding protein